MARQSGEVTGKDLVFWFPEGVEAAPQSDDAFVTELASEKAVVDRIVAAHQAHKASARRYAASMAEEASFLSEEGPRETEAESGDEDIEAAAEAASARAAAARTVLAWKRVRELDAAGSSLAFGRISGEEGDSYIGRTTVFERDDAVLIDWRAAAAAPFYRATPLEPMGVIHRRHLHYTDDVLTNYSDEVFDTESIDTFGHLRGEAALLRSLTNRSDDRMKSVVATIQAEQDAVIRASERGPLLVQGGPGTGKTVVALHRAAYLLYADRAALAESGVLIVGPSPQFLSYISDVLPSLGESGVVSVTADQLHPGVLVDPDPDPTRAALKGSAAMVKFVACAVTDRQRPPVEPLTAWYGSRRLAVDTTLLQQFFAQAQNHTTHNAGHRVLRGRIVDQLVDDTYEPGFETRADLRLALLDGHDVRLFMERHWPVLSPEQALNDVLGSPALLASAAASAGLDDVERDLLETPRTPESEVGRRRWEQADIPLLDEFQHCLGDESEALERDDEMEHTAADSLDVFALADAADEASDETFADNEDVDLTDDDFIRYDGWGDGDEQATWR